jgi:hypothetical protein
VGVRNSSNTWCGRRHTHGGIDTRRACAALALLTAADRGIALAGGAEAKVAPLFRALSPAVAARLSSERAPSAHAVAHAGLVVRPRVVGVSDADSPALVWRGMLTDSPALWRCGAAACARDRSAAACRGARVSRRRGCATAPRWLRAVHSPRSRDAAAAALPQPLRPGVDASSLAHALAAARAPQCAPPSRRTRDASRRERSPQRSGHWRCADGGRAVRLRGALSPQEDVANVAWVLATARHDAPALRRGGSGCARGAAAKFRRFCHKASRSLFAFSYASFAHDAPPALTDALAVGLDARLVEVVVVAPQVLRSACVSVWRLAFAAGSLSVLIHLRTLTSSFVLWWFVAVCVVAARTGRTSRPDFTSEAHVSFPPADGARLHKFSTSSPQADSNCCLAPAGKPLPAAAGRARRATCRASARRTEAAAT